MFVFDITIKNNNLEYQDCDHDIASYVYFLERTGQVLKREHMVIQNEKTIRIPVICPEIDSFSLKNCSQNALEVFKRIEANSGSKIEHSLSGRDTDNLNYQVPENSSYYILRNGWSSPLICGDTHQAIPLYKLPIQPIILPDYP